MDEKKVKKIKEVCLCAFVSTQLFTSYEFILFDEPNKFPAVVFALKDKGYIGETDLFHIQNLKTSLGALAYYIDLNKKLVKYFLNEN